MYDKQVIFLVCVDECERAYVFVCVYVCLCACMCMLAFEIIYMKMFVSVRVSVCVCVRACVCVYAYTYVRSINILYLPGHGIVLKHFLLIHNFFNNIIIRIN